MHTGVVCIRYVHYSPGEDKNIRAAGFEPGTPEYKSKILMAT